MASLPTRAPAFHSIGTLRRPSAAVHAPSLIFVTSGRHCRRAHLNFRFQNEGRVQVKNRWAPVLASNTNPSEESNDSKTSDEAAAAPGPPLLTILAGLVVFLIICWFVGSIAMWLIGLIVNPPPLK
ncbi:hypothetical protein ACP275_14G167800 [Erythranthe tilingii]